MGSPSSWMAAWAGIPGLIIAVASIFLMFQRYLAAELCFWLAGAWTLIAWRFSDFVKRGEKEIARLKRKANRSTANRSTRDTYESRRSYYYWRERGVSVSIGVLTICALLWMRMEGHKFELSLWEGRLYPGNEDVPAIHCPVDGDTLLLFLGSNGIAYAKVFPRPVIRVKDVDILTIDKNEDGSLAVSAIIKRADGKVLAEIKRGEFILAQGHIFKKERPSVSQLRVTDEFGDVVLDVNFFNPRAMWIAFKSYGFEFHGSKLQNNQTCLGGRDRVGSPMIWMFPPLPPKAKGSPEDPKSDP